MIPDIRTLPRITMPISPETFAPDCSFLRTDGTAVRLSDFLGKPLVLIFLRHLA
jgi:peroxiredoxin